MTWTRQTTALFVALFAVLVLSVGPASAQTPVGTVFTYQARLTNAGAPANGPHDLRFRLFDALGGGAQIGPTVCLDNVNVSAGLFTVQLDFGQRFATPQARFLEIEVRGDTGLDCSNTSGYTLLSPRQRLTVAPIAAHAQSAFALDSADGSVPNAVFVDNVGRVGIGTTTPNSALTVNGDMEIGVNSSDYQHLRIGGGNSDGFLYGSFPHFGDGIHLGYNYFADGSGTNHVIHTDGGTSRFSMHYGALVFATAPAFTGEPAERVRIDSAGNVGVGTAIPISKLDVRGDIRLGGSGQYLAVGAEENLRLVRGSVNQIGCGEGATITAGSGFTVTSTSRGVLVVNFTTPFSGPATVVASAKPSGCDAFCDVVGVTNASFEVHLKTDACGDGACSSGFHFIAVGPR